MIDSTAATIRNYWDWRATSFDDSSAQQQSWWQVYAKALDATRSLQILDIGTGTGFIAQGLAKGGHRVTALDISPAMLNQARTRAGREGLAIHFFAADAKLMAKACIMEDMAAHPEAEGQDVKQWRDRKGVRIRKNRCLRINSSRR